MLGLIVACGIEVLVDWNQSIFEINVLRSAIRQKGESYVSILSKASDDELTRVDAPGLERLSSGVFDDLDTIYVRFTDSAGHLVWDRVKDGYDVRFGDNGDTFTQHYARLMQRDTVSILHDPAELKSRVAASRYKDLAQAWSDATARVVSLVAPPPSPPRNAALVVYQDRLRDEKHERDDKVTYAIGTVLDAGGKTVGTVLVAFDMRRTNDGIRLKYLKFAGMVIFFVGLILVQNIVSRRDKLKLFDVEARYSTAKKALREAMPQKDLVVGSLRVTGSLHQAKGSVDGMVWGAAEEGGAVLLTAIDPDGDGIDAAAVGLHALNAFNARRDATAKARPALDGEAAALGEAAGGIPLTRPIGVLLLRVDPESGAYEALFGDFAQLALLEGGAVSAPTLEPVPGEPPAGVVGPLFRTRGTLEPGSALVAFCVGMSSKEVHVDVDAVAKYLLRTQEPGKTVASDDAVLWARGRHQAVAENDIAILAVSREPRATT